MPRRRCAGCGRTAPREELVRFAVAREGGRPSSRAVVDPTCTMPGRGAYLCRSGGAQTPAESCLQTALSRGAITRVLRSHVAVDLGDRSTEVSNS